MTDTTPGRSELGPNAGLVDEMYRLFQENPQDVSARWREFFADYKPAGTLPAAPPAPAPPPPPPATPAAPIPPPAPAPTTAGNGRSPVVLAGEAPEQLRGAAA